MFFVILGLVFVNLVEIIEELLNVIIGSDIVCVVLDSFVDIMNESSFCGFNGDLMFFKFNIVVFGICIFFGELLDVLGYED